MSQDWQPKSADDYAELIEGELPQGNAWPRDPDKPLMLWVRGCAQIWGDVDGTAAELLVVESDPRYTIKLLPDWERNFGLPDPCIPVVQSIPERQRALVNKMTTEGGQSIPFFVGVAKTLGYTIAIEEYLPFQFGLSSFGGPRGRFMGPLVRFTWKVHVYGGRLTRFRFGRSSFGRDAFLEIRHAEDLECIFRRWAPAHTIVVFDYLNRDPRPAVVRFEFGISRFGNDPFTHVIVTP